MYLDKYIGRYRIHPLKTFLVILKKGNTSYAKSDLNTPNKKIIPTRIKNITRLNTNNGITKIPRVTKILSITWIIKNNFFFLKINFFICSKPSTYLILI